MKTNIKMRVTLEQSKRVQEICFKNNIAWHGVKAFYHLRQPYIYVYEKTLGYDCKESSEYFDDHENIEIDADLFIRTNGTCEEISDEGLSKIKAASHGKPTEYLQEKIINLHKQINKDRATIKNQKEELNKLNLKLQKCISLEEHNQIMQKYKSDLLAGESELLSVKSHNERLNEVARNINDLLGKQIDIKDNQDKEIEKLKAVIEYLESKVK